MAHLELRSLVRRFGAHTALDGIDIDLPEGEFLSLLGPSGCGKTTALRIVAGFDLPDAGAVRVDGRDLTRVPPNKRAPRPPNRPAVNTLKVENAGKPPPPGRAAPRRLRRWRLRGNAPYTGAPPWPPPNKPPETSSSPPHTALAALR